MSIQKVHSALWDALSAIVESGVLRVQHASNTDRMHADAVQALELAATERAKADATGHPNVDGHTLEVHTHGSYQVAIVTIARDHDDHPGEPAYAIELRDERGSPKGCITTSYPGRAGFGSAKDRAATVVEFLALLDEL